MRPAHPHRKFTITALLVLLAFAGINAQQVNWSVDWNTHGSFIENKGQFSVPGRSSVPASDILYGVDNTNTRIYFTRDGVTFSMVDMNKRKKTEEEKAEELRSDLKCRTNRVAMKHDVVHMRWLGADPDAEVHAEEMTPDFHSYSTRDFSGAWINTTEIRSYRKLTYVNLYPGIDVEYLIHPQGGIKYNIILHPGADLSKVRMQYTDASGITIDPAGNLLLPTLFGNIIDHAPVTYYSGDKNASISSAFVLNANIVTFRLGNYDHSKTVVIDPWTVTPAFGNCNKIWECEHDAAGNVYLYGGDSPMRLRKYNSAGTLQWTFNTAWDTASYWVGSFVVDQAGNSYCTSGSNGEIVKVNTSGAQQWFNNPNGLFGPLFEYWHLTLNCDETQLVVGGMRAPNPFSISNYRGAVMNINLANGAVLSFLPVGWVAGINIKEVKSITWAPNGNFYFLTLDSIGCVTPALSLSWKTTSGYGFSYGTCGYGVTNQGISAIRCTAGSIYTQNGTTVHQRNIANGAITATAAIPGGSSNSTFGNSPNNSGLDIDNCGNVYCGSTNQVVKYDANLNQLLSVATTAAVYDVSVNIGGEVIVCGPGYASSINMSACVPVVLSCNATVPLSVTSTFSNVNCFGQCTGSASVTASGGNGTYTYAWTPTGGNTSSASSLCAGTYTCTITDGLGATTTATFNITQPASALSATGSQTNAACSGGTGSASVTPSGGTGTYTYAWSPSGGNSSTASGLAAGGYTCTITDANGCTTTQSFTITAPSALSATSSQTNALCSNSTGTASVSATGGTGSYTYAWAPSGGNAPSATGLAAGTYTCTITDANSCTTTQTFNLTAPAALSATSSSTPSACGNNNGSASVAASGGTGAYGYSWAPSGGNASTESGLASGNYTCTITDANGCTTSATVNVASSGGPATSVQAFTDVSCFGGTDGSGTVSATGSGPFTYAWAPSGGNAASATNLAANVYTVTVTDINGCSTAQTVTITEPTAVAPSVSSFTDATCGNNDGTATATATGGTGSYTYAWSPAGGNAATAIGLGAGIYTVTVTDANGCSSTASVTISNIGAPAVTLQSLSDVTCFGLTNGAATVSATGSGPFTYAWSPSGGNAATASNLGAGIYTVTVTDNGGCTAIQTVTITEPALLNSSIAATDATCGNANGTASVTPTGGTGPFTYAWSNSQTTQQITGLIAGTYSVTVTDANGCTTSSSAIVNTTGAPTVALSSFTDATCFGQANGAAQVTASGGQGPYTYSWFPSGGTGAAASGLGAGTYTCTVTGSDGCSQTQTVTISQPSVLIATSSSSPEDCNSTNGSAAVSVSGGTPGYVLAWNTGSSNDTITGLASGSYTCTITDANGCTQTTTVLVGSAGSATADAGLDVTISQGQSTGLSGSGGISYNWSPANSLDCPTCADPNASPTVTTTYVLTVTDSLGCTDTDSVTVFVDITCGEVYLPSAFSPNNDGQNDVYYVRGNCIAVMQFEVYNRWGEMVFSTTDPDIGWDGTWRGKDCEAAVFTYFLRATLLDGTPVEAEGNISLVK